MEFPNILPHYFYCSWLYPWSNQPPKHCSPRINYATQSSTSDWKFDPPINAIQVGEVFGFHSLSKSGCFHCRWRRRVYPLGSSIVLHSRIAGYSSCWTNLAILAEFDFKLFAPVFQSIRCRNSSIPTQLEWRSASTSPITRCFRSRLRVLVFIILFYLYPCPLSRKSVNKQWVC